MLPIRALQRLFRALHHLATSQTEAHVNLRHRLAAAVIVTALIDLIGSALDYHFEHDRVRDGISSFGEAVFWTTAQLLTVSSQMPNPVTTGGRIVDILLELYAIVVVTTVAGSWADFFHHRREERQDAQAAR